MADASKAFAAKKISVAGLSVALIAIAPVQARGGHHGFHAHRIGGGRAWVHCRHYRDDQGLRQRVCL